jgi:hypothetical protein
MYIIRTVFWLSVVVLLIPSGNPEQSDAAPAAEDQSAVSTGEAVNAALSTIGDVASLCERQPDVCEVGSAAWDVFQRKAQYGFNLIYRWTTGSGEPQHTANWDGSATYLIQVSDATEQLHTGSTDQEGTPTSTTSAPPSQNTLQIEDLIPAWGGPYVQERA